MTTGSVEDGITALTYEAALAELDTLISKLEGGSIALEEAIGAYERGVILAQHCSDLLAHTEHRVQATRRELERRARRTATRDRGIGRGAEPPDCGGADTSHAPADRPGRRPFLTARIHRDVV